MPVSRKSLTCRTEIASACPAVHRPTPSTATSGSSCARRLRAHAQPYPVLGIELVKLLIACHLFHRFSRANIRPRSLAIRHAHQNNGAENVRPQERTIPRRPAPPSRVLRDCFRLVEGVDEANNICAQLKNVVVLDGLWPICLCRIHAGPVRRRGIRPRPTPSIDVAKSTTTLESRGKGQRAALRRPRRCASWSRSIRQCGDSFRNLARSDGGN